jgi:succinate dehydrogenase/fumarate reductase flavoprotein subunit
VDEHVDVLVVGSGGGMAGAYTAAREGLSVQLVEATDKFGGTTAYSGGGGMWFPCNPVVTRAGVDDTIDDALEYFHAVVGDRTPLELQETYVRAGAGLIEYLEADDNFAFAELPWPDYFGKAPKARADGRRHIVPVPLRASQLGPYAGAVRGPLDTDRLGTPPPDVLTGGRALIGRFVAALRRFPNAALQLSCPLVDLVTDDGAVTGAVVRRGGEDVTIAVRRGVLLAAGGFEHNPSLREFYGVPGSSDDTMGCCGNTGTAHEAALRVGAGTDLMDQAWWSPGLTHPDGRSAFALWFTGGIFVNQNGERFVNESAPYDRLGRHIIDQINCGTMQLPYWMVYDNREGEVPPVKATNVSMVETARYRAAGLWHTASTLDELAQLIGVPAANLARAVNRFNELVRRGRDEDFGRGDEPYDRAFSRGKPPLVAIEEPPFHAARFGLSDLGTKGGLRTDTSARVLDTAGEPIPGLYAAGNTMAAVSGTVYPGGGNPIGASLLFSHLAALHMATNGPRQ